MSLDVRIGTSAVSITVKQFYLNTLQMQLVLTCVELWPQEETVKQKGPEEMGSTEETTK